MFTGAAPLVCAAQPPIPPNSNVVSSPDSVFPPSWNWSPTLTFAASATVIWMLVVELVPCPIPAHPCARFSASPDFEYVAARPVPCGLFPGLIPGSQNADWPPATGDCADAAHCVPDTDEKLSTVIAGGGAVRPDSGDGKSTTTGTSVRPYGSASKVIVRMPMGNRPSWSTPPHVHVDACARKASNRSGSAGPVPGSRVHLRVQVCWLISFSSTSRAAVSVENPAGVPVSPGTLISIGRVMVRLDAW